MPLNLTNEKSTFVQAMAWCCHATSHHLSQCSVSQYGVTRPQWVNLEKRLIQRLPLFCVSMSMISWLNIDCVASVARTPRKGSIFYKFPRDAKGQLLSVFNHWMWNTLKINLNILRPQQMVETMVFSIVFSWVYHYVFWLKICQKISVPKGAIRQLWFR